MNETTISTKGQIVIPQEFRERYRLYANSTAVWIDLGGVLMLTPRRRDPVLESRGILSKSGFTQKSLRQARGLEKKKP